MKTYKNHLLLMLIASFLLIMFYQLLLAAEQSEVITELSERSHIPAGKVKELLTNCYASALTQLNINLCADRDATIAKLKKTLFNKKLSLVACKSMLEIKIAKWGKLRNRSL